MGLVFFFACEEGEREGERDSDADVKFLLSFIKNFINWVGVFLFVLHFLFYVFGNGKKLGLHEKQRYVRVRLFGLCLTQSLSLSQRFLLAYVEQLSTMSLSSSLVSCSDSVHI